MVMSRLIFLILLIFPSVSWAQPAQQPGLDSFKQGSLKLQENFYHPRWSPDDRFIAVTKENYSGIYLIDLLTMDVLRLSDEPSSGFHMVWSPGGKFILTNVSKIQGNRNPHATVLYQIEPRVEKNITQFEYGIPAQLKWEEPGKSFYMYKAGKLNYTDLNGNEITKLKEGQEVLFSVGSELNRIHDGGRKTSILISPEGEKLNIQVSPDGSWITYEILGGNMWVSNRDGSELIDLGQGHRPRWNPSGDQILFMVSEDDGHQIVSSDIFVVNFDGSERINLTRTNDRHELDPDWSPNGKHFVFSTTSGDIIIQRIMQ